MNKTLTIMRNVVVPDYFGTNLFECLDDCPLAFKRTEAEFYGCECPFKAMWNSCPLKGEGDWHTANYN